MVASQACLEGWGGFCWAETVEVEEVGQGILGGGKAGKEESDGLSSLLGNHDRVSMVGEAGPSLEGHRCL